MIRPATFKIIPIIVVFRHIKLSLSREENGGGQPAQYTRSILARAEADTRARLGLEVQMPGTSTPGAVEE